jgi:phosphatidylinositol alpha-1,6-mannosyltransferase
VKTLITGKFFPYSWGGIEPCTVALADYLHELGETVTVVTFRFTPKDDEFDRSRPYRVVRLPYVRSIYLQTLLMFLATTLYYLRDGYPKIFAALWLPCGVAALPVVKFFGPKLFISVYGDDVVGWKLSDWGRRWMRRTLNAADRVFAISRFIGSETRVEMRRPDRVKVVPVGITEIKTADPTRVAELVAEHGLEGKKVVLTLARLVDRKGQDTVIKAMPKILKAVPNAVYLVAGSGHCLPALERLARQLGVAERVKFLGFVPHEDKEAYFRISDVYVMVSKVLREIGSVEGFGITYLEAAAQMRPSVGGTGSGSEDAIVDGVTGYLVDPLDVDAVADRIIRVLADSGLRDRLGRAGRERVAQEFLWRGIIERMKAIADDACPGRPRGSRP